jgi:hypothetical protein
MKTKSAQAHAKAQKHLGIPAVQVNVSGTVVIDVEQVRKLARSCSTYAVGKMLAKHGVPIHEAIRLLRAPRAPWLWSRFAIVFYEERWNRQTHDQDVRLAA